MKRQKSEFPSYACLNPGCILPNNVFQINAFFVHTKKEKKEIMASVKVCAKPKY